MVEYSEKELMEQVCKGDDKAFGDVFRHHYKGLCAYSYTILKDHHVAEEIVQDFFSGLWENQNLRKVDISLKLYLYRSIHNKCMNHLKSLAVAQNRYKRYIQYIEAENELMDMDVESEGYERLFSGDFEKNVFEAIDALAPQQKKIFTLSRFQQKSYTDIANELDISINSVKKQMSRALQKLRASLIEKMGKHPFIFFIHLVTLQ